MKIRTTRTNSWNKCQMKISFLVNKYENISHCLAPGGWEWQEGLIPTLNPRAAACLGTWGCSTACTAQFRPGWILHLLLAPQAPSHCTAEGSGCWKLALKKTAATSLLTALAMLVGKIHCQRADVTCSVLHQTPQAPGLVLFSVSPFLPFNSTLTDHRCVCLPPMQYSALRNSDRHLLLAADGDTIRNSIQAASQAGRVNTNTPRTKH